MIPLKHKIKVAASMDQVRVLDSEQATKDLNKLSSLLAKAESYKFFHKGIGFWLLNLYVRFLFNRMSKNWILK